ncbi:MAG: hypothetical protein QM682_17280 [Paracoccus sp. (in: a-proteobacteria)]|uniref:hypothetical protein n=1 Tax=Paracoccus sp. TaxID=267 RepID=UPI0039E43692
MPFILRISLNAAKTAQLSAPASRLARNALSGSGRKAGTILSRGQSAGATASVDAGLNGENATPFQ